MPHFGRGSGDKCLFAVCCVVYFLVFIFGPARASTTTSSDVLFKASSHRQAVSKVDDDIGLLRAAALQRFRYFLSANCATVRCLVLLASDESTTGPASTLELAGAGPPDEADPSTCTTAFRFVPPLFIIVIMEANDAGCQATKVLTNLLRGAH